MSGRVYFPGHSTNVYSKSNISRNLYILPGAKPVRVLNGQKSPLGSLDGLTFIPVYLASSRRKNSGENDAQLMVPAFSDYQASEMKM